MYVFGDLFPSWDDEKEVECQDCLSTESLLKYCDQPIKEVLKNHKCANCGSGCFTVSGDEFSSIPVLNLYFAEDFLMGASFPLYTSYGGMAGLEFLGYECINNSILFGITRSISSVSLSSSLVYESYHVNGHLKKASSHKYLQLSSNNKLLPVKHIEEGKEIYRVIELERGITAYEISKEEEKWRLESESEWIYELPYEHLAQVNGRYTLNTGIPKIDIPKYDLGNNGPHYTGFTNKIISEKGDYQRFYIVNGYRQDMHPVWTFDKDHCLVSIDCKLGDDDFNIYNVENVEYNEDFGGDIYN